MDGLRRNAPDAEGCGEEVGSGAQMLDRAQELNAVALFLEGVVGGRCALDGYRIRPPEVEQTAPGRFLITIHEGRNRQIRRMCAAAGLEVLRLRRIAEGPLQLGTLAPGAWRPLTEAELAALRQETEGGDPV